MFGYVNADNKKGLWRRKNAPGCLQPWEYVYKRSKSEAELFKAKVLFRKVCDGGVITGCKNYSILVKDKSL